MIQQYRFGYRKTSKAMQNKKESIIACLKSHGYTMDRYGHYTKEVETPKGKRKHRYKISKNSIRKEVKGEYGWTRLSSAYIRDVEVTEDNKIKGMSYNGCIPKSKPKKEDTMSMSMDKAIVNPLEHEVNRQLLLYAAGQHIFCPHCQQIMDFRRTIIFSVQKDGKDIKTFSMCVDCFEKKKDILHQTIENAKMLHPEKNYSYNILDGRKYK